MFAKIAVPVAAFLVTVTGASAFTGGAWLSNLSADDLGITQEQKSALEEAITLRHNAREQAENVLAEADIDAATWENIREAVREERDTHHEAVEEALESGDYDAFRKAVGGTPVADVIDTEDEFEKFAEAHELMEAGDRDGARGIMDELGLERGRGFGGMGMLRAGEGFGHGKGEGYGRGAGMGRGMGQGMGHGMVR